MNEQTAPVTHEGERVLFPPLPYDMRRRSDAAVKDDALRAAVEAATLTKDTARKATFAEAFGERYDALRGLAERIKQHTLDHLDYYLDQFIDHAEAAGATVHYAADAAEANRVCLGIAEREGVRACVKAKSMVTEEVRLLEALQAAGVETLETDLGEFILQLDGDAPSHIVTPMIHKDRASVGRAFERELGAAYTDEPDALTAIAREHLRDKYRRADMGVTGGNFLVAGSGSVVVCTNEGNGTFCASTPRVHVAVVGIEKLVPTFEHAAVLLKLLARSSTAQPLTVYTDILTGPKRRDEHDGPEQLHVVLVDNGRTELLADPVMRDTLRCIRCGACLNACPVYRTVGGHSYGAVYTGPIGALVTPMLKGLTNYPDLPQASSLCGACGEACPVNIDIPHLLVHLRNELNAQRVAGRAERRAFKLYAWVLKKPWRYRWASRLVRFVLRRRADDDGYVTRAPGPGKGWTETRDLPAPAKQSFRQWWKQNKRDEPQRHRDTEVN